MSCDQVDDYFTGVENSDDRPAVWTVDVVGPVDISSGVEPLPGLNDHLAGIGAAEPSEVEK